MPLGNNSALALPGRLLAPFCYATTLQPPALLVATLAEGTLAVVKWNGGHPGSLALASTWKPTPAVEFAPTVHFATASTVPLQTGQTEPTACTTELLSAVCSASRGTIHIVAISPHPRKELQEHLQFYGRNYDEVSLQELAVVELPASAYGPPMWLDGFLIVGSVHMFTSSVDVLVDHVTITFTVYTPSLLNHQGAINCIAKMDFSRKHEEDSNLNQVRSTSTFPHFNNCIFSFFPVLVL